MRMNAPLRLDPVFTHEGGPARHIPEIAQLRRSVLSCMLWEREFYEDGAAIADRIAGLAAKVSAKYLADLAVEARTQFGLRHVSLLLARELAKRPDGRPLVRDTLKGVLKRADEPAEFLALYWAKGKTPLAYQVRLGLQDALASFSEYQLAKYDRAGKVKMRDVFRIARPKPVDDQQAELWRKAVKGELATPDTWEVALSRGDDKKEAFERLLRDGALGYFALLRNLRNMATAGVDVGLVREALLARKGAKGIEPFRFIAAARAAPQFEPWIDEALIASLDEFPPLSGRTIVLVDVSGSMDDPLSAKSDLKRIDAAAALASIVTGDIRVFSFSNGLVEVPPRRGMAGVDAVIKSQQHGGTYLGAAVQHINGLPHDRLIVITDEQSHDRVPDPTAQRAYMINVASAKHGVGYGKWTHLDGFSEAVLRWIGAFESDDAG